MSEREQILQDALEDALELICDEWGTSLEDLATEGWNGKEDLIDGAKIILAQRNERGSRTSS